MRLRRFAGIVAALADTACKSIVLALRWRLRTFRAPRVHGLGRPLIVTLTSYPQRFGTLALTLKSLLTQSMRPDAVVLWIAHDDLPLLPDAVKALTREGLSIRGCEDLRSYKKLVPALSAFPGAVLVTADDDLYYWRDWLAGLVEAHREGGEVVCYRAHWVPGDGRPYKMWTANIGPSGPDGAILPTTGGGVLYPPGVFGPHATEQALFSNLSPDADDLWFYFMLRTEGRAVRKIGRPRRFRPWAGSQKTSLYALNADPIAGNDAKFARLADVFGRPVP